MDVALVFVLPLIGGFIFLHRWNVTRFNIARAEGQYVYFHAALCAAILFIIVFFIRELVLQHWGRYMALDARATAYLLPLLKETATRQHSEVALVAAYAFLSGTLLWWPLNLITGRKLFWYRRAIIGNDCESLLYAATSRAIPVCFTMTNDKVYAGFVTQYHASHSERKFVAILPLMSGYRAKDTREIIFMTYYTHIFRGADSPNEPLASPLEHLTGLDFEVVVPIASVCSLNLFDLIAYEQFRNREKTPRGKQAAARR
jgi:hypothetical protein